MHHLRLPGPCHILLLWLVIEFWMEVVISLWGWFLLLDDERVGLCPGIFAASGYLPADFHAWCPSSDLAPPVADLLRNVEVGSRSTDGCELIAKFLVEGLKPEGKLYDGFPLCIENCDSIVEVFHIGRLDAGVGEVLVSWVERMVNLEASGGFVYMA